MQKSLKMEKGSQTAVKKKRVAPPVKRENVLTRDRIKPRGLAGLYKGKIFYDKNADIFNLNL